MGRYRRADWVLIGRKMHLWAARTVRERPMTDVPTGSDPNGTSTDPSVTVAPVGEADCECDGTAPACPLCESDRVEQITMPDELLVYRCLDCNAAYDETGQRVRFE